MVATDTAGIAMKESERELLEEILEDIDDRLKRVEDDVGNLNEFAFGSDESIDTRGAAEDLRMLRNFYRRFKSFKFIFGAIVGVLTFLATVGWAVYQLVDLVQRIFK